MTALPIFAAFLRRDWRVEISYRRSFVLQLGSIVFFLAVFFYVGRLLGNARFGSHHGDYFAYAAVGLFLLEIITVSLASFTTKLREEQTTGTFEALMATPVSPALIVLASAAYDLLRATLSGLILLVVAIALFGLRIETDPGSLLVAIVALVGCLALFASLGVLVAAATVVLKKASAVLGLVVTGLALLGGVYFPLDVLPGPLEAIAEALPFTWGLDVLRASLLGGDVDAIQLAGLYGSAAVLLSASLMAFAAAVRRARRAGSLAEY